MIKERRHLTEAYDHMLPGEYKTKGFSRLSKSGIKAEPNHLGLELIDKYRSRVGMEEDSEEEYS